MPIAACTSRCVREVGRLRCPRDPWVNREKSKSEIDKELDTALDETFPASDAIAVDRTEDEPIRPVDRKPALIDKGLVEKLSEQAKTKKE